MISPAQKWDVAKKLMLAGYTLKKTEDEKGHTFFCAEGNRVIVDFELLCLAQNPVVMMQSEESHFNG